MVATTRAIKTKATAAAASAWQQRGEQRGGIAAAAAALLQRGGSGGSTINNQLKASASTATETATMIAITTMMIKTKGTVAGWRQLGGQRGGIAAAPAALLQRSKSTRGGGWGNT